MYIGHQMNALLQGHSDSARYGEYLSSGDHAHLRAFIHELVGKRLLPHLNEALKSLNEWVRLLHMYMYMYAYVCMYDVHVHMYI